MTSAKKNQPWGQLGAGAQAVNFVLQTAPTDLSSSYDWNFVEMARIQGKPLLQQVGGTLRKITLPIRLHHMFCDPQAEFDRMFKLAQSAEPQPLVIGEKYLGDWVIESLPIKWKKTDAQAVLLILEVEIKLKEWVGVKDKGKRPRATTKTAGRNFTKVFR